MMVAERATAPESAAPCSEQNNQADDITKCAFCGARDGISHIEDTADRDVYQLGDGQWVCVEHIGLVVSLAANDVFSDCVSYTREFERVLM